MFDAAAHELSICNSLVERKVEISSVLGLIDAMGVLPVALFIIVLFITVQTNYSS